MIETKFGTKVIDGIEYNEHPSPSSVIKATGSRWAYKLKDHGYIRLSSTRFYQTVENVELGDPNEGSGMLQVNGHPIESSSSNEVFIWCSALDSTPHATLKGFNTNYNTVIQITDTVEFVKRILNAAKDAGHTLTPQLGRVQYNRGDEVTKEVLNEQKWHANIFQKDSRYSHQQEFRFAFSNFTLYEIGFDHLDLVLGDCNDIIKILA